MNTLSVAFIVITYVWYFFVRVSFTASMAVLRGVSMKETVARKV